jgi:hypothetical protein
MILRSKEEMLKECEELEYKQPETLGQRAFNDGVEEVIRRLNLRESVCSNCTDGCKAEWYCDGCDTMLCIPCWKEHNKDAYWFRNPCHVGR